MSCSHLPCSQLVIPFFFTLLFIPLLIFTLLFIPYIVCTFFISVWSVFGVGIDMCARTVLNYFPQLYSLSKHVFLSFSTSETYNWLVTPQSGYTKLFKIICQKYSSYVLRASRRYVNMAKQIARQFQHLAFSHRCQLTFFREPISVEIRVAVAIWRLATDVEFRTNAATSTKKIHANNLVDPNRAFLYPCHVLHAIFLHSCHIVCLVFMCSCCFLCAFSCMLATCMHCCLDLTSNTLSYLKGAQLQNTCYHAVDNNNHHCCVVVQHASTALVSHHFLSPLDF